jgi:hypothetical protein
LALAEGRQASEPEHFLLAMVYGAHTRMPAIGPPRRARVDAEEDLAAALRRRG